MNNQLLQQFVFVLTGVATTIASQIVFYHGAGDKETLLPVIANLLGSTLILLYYSDNDQNEKENASTPSVNHTYSYLKVAFFDFIGNILTAIGLAYVGSGLYQVLYSSNVLFGGVLSRIILKKSLNRNQWIGLLIISGGLGLSTFGSVNLSPSDQSKLFQGVVITLLGTICYSMSYISSESVLNSPNPPTAENLQGYSGLYALTASFIYFFVYTLPNWRELVTNNVLKNNGSINIIIASFMVVIVSGFFHSLFFFKLIKNVGAVSTGVMQSIRAVAVFFLSSLLFCSSYKNQCYNTNKIMGTFIAVGGLLFYSRNTPQKTATEPTEDKFIA